MDNDKFEDNGENLAEISDYYQEKVYKFVPDQINITGEIFPSYKFKSYLKSLKKAYGDDIEEKVDLEE